MKAHYKTFNKISLLFDEDETLPIQNYAPLLIIGESERKDKRQELDKKDEEGKSKHETLFESKSPIDLELLLDRDSLKRVKEKRVLVLGSAGVGKSTLCQYIAYQWSIGNLWSQFKAVFWIKLRYLSKDF